MECGSCTLCCKLLLIASMNSPAGEYCKACSEGVGCNIYSERPEECKDYRCAYHQTDKCSENIRPDKTGVIFERLSDHIFIAVMEKETKMNKDVIGQIRAFNQQGFSVSLSVFGVDIPMMFPTAETTAESVFKEAKALLSNKHGSGKLHN